MGTLGVDLGGTHLRCARVSDEGAVEDKHERETPHDGAGTEVLVAAMGKVREGTDHAVVGVPGRVDYRTGRLETGPNLPPAWIPGLTESALAAAVGIPVSLANDADLAAVGEAYFGAGAAYTDVAYLTLSTGIGAGVVLGGLLVHGHRSLAEVGHTIIDLDAPPGLRTLEERASGTALKRATSARVQDVVDRAAAGDPAAREAWAGLVRAAQAGVVNVAWTFSPEVIVIGGGVGLVGDVLLDPLRDALAELHLDVAVTNARLGDDAGLAGAAAWHKAFVPEHAGR